MKTEKMSFALGLILTLLITGISYKYFEHKKTIDALKQAGPLMDTLEAIDLRFNDMKYKFRDVRETKSKVALIAIDDESVQEIGRWPWSREVVAELSQKAIGYGANVIGFDAIFSEPEKSNPQADLKFAEVISKDPAKFVLGTFSESPFNYKPFQDFCVVEAFLKTGGDEIVKVPNISITVDDLAEGPFDQLNWGSFFGNQFELIYAREEKNVLNKYSKNSVEELNPYQKNYLKAVQSNAVFESCSTWAPGVEVDKATEEGYMNVFRQDQKLASLPFADIIKKITQELPVHSIPEYGQWTPNILPLQKPALYTASFIAKPDMVDGAIRRYPLFYRSGGKLGSSFIPALALQTYLLAKGFRAEVRFEKAGMGAGTKVIKAITIFDPKSDPERKVIDLPIDDMGQMIVNYYGRQATLPYISAKEFFSDDPMMHVKINRNKSNANQDNIELVPVKKSEFLKDRSLIFGATAIGIYDWRNTPIQTNYPGPEIHLSVLANLLDQDFLHPWSGESLWMPIILLFFGLGLSWILSHVGPLSSILVGLGFAVIAGFIDFALFIKYHVVTSSVLVLIELASVYFLITIFKYFTEEKKKRELKSTFSKYVSPAVVDELLKDVENLKLGGRKQRLTAFFSDIRGFTTISEKLSPTDLSKLLNRYLTPMTEIVFKNNGTLDKYMGDAVMAFFGAPIASPDHAAQACRCALQSLMKLKELQKELAAEGLPNIDIGIGLNTGEMSVGNMGSNIVQNYTIMGDSVNLASRLEGINKEYGTRIIISEFTYADVKDKFIAREVDRVKVKGKTEPVRIFELIQEEPLSASQVEHLQCYQEGYSLYYQREFEKARECFQKALSLKSDDEVSQLYIERSDEYILASPPPDWDGVYVMKTK